MMRLTMNLSFCALSLLLAPLASAWVPAMPSAALLSPLRTAAAPTTTTALQMAIDYNDPEVAAEFANVQPMTFEEAEEELLQSGVRVSPTMNDMEVKLMLVEVRMQAAKQNSNGSKKQKPAKFSSKFEEAMWTKPAFEELFNKLEKKGDHNAMNVITEFVSDPEMARKRYSSNYQKILRLADQALNAPPPVKTPTVQFSGFPANMGEAGCKMTLESIGAVADFECQEDEDFPVLKGKVTFEDIESAKKAIAQYNGMDMGMGTALEMTSV